jgi:hypothetical protein
MRNRLSATPIGPIYTTPVNAGPKPLDTISVANFGGLNTVDDPRDIDPGQLTVANNIDIDTNVWDRRTGYNILTPTKPDSTKVLSFQSVELYNSSIVQLRFDSGKIYRRGSGSWTEITGGGLAGGDNDRFSVTTLLNRFFCSNNGVDVIQELDLTGNTYADLGNAPAYKYITAYYNRIVGAYNTTSLNPIEVGWSGDINLDEWDPVTDPSAGSNPLYDTPTNYADQITGLFTFGDYLIIPRERSIYLATKQPIATVPFYFYPAVLNIGSDLPYSICIVKNGICFADRRTRMVYYYEVGTSAPIPIGQQIYNILNIANLDPDTIYSGYDPYHQEYVLGVPSASSTVTTQYIFNFKTQVWYTEVINNASFIGSSPFSAQTAAIQDLIGNIEDLTGDIDSLSPSTTFPTRFVGLTNGDILQSSDSADTDGGVTYTFDIQSKTFEENGFDFYVKRLNLIFMPIKTGSFSVYYSTDNSNTWTLYKDVSVSSTDIGDRQLVTCVKLIKCRQYSFRITSTSGLFSITHYEIERDPGGPSRN